MMMMRFEQSIDEIKREDVKRLNNFLKNEMAGLIFIHALAEYIKKHFNAYVEKYGDGSEKLSEVNINIVIDSFFSTYQNEIKPAWENILSNI